jgi:DNA-binding response OmpR family regulator
MKRRILLVDDEVAVLLTLKAVLEISGYEVHTAASAKEARSQLKKHTYSMVITDMRMENDEAGAEVIRAARTAEYHPAVALLTAFPVAEEDWQEMDTDKVEVLMKPMHTKILLQQIEALLAKHDAKIQKLVGTLSGMWPAGSQASTPAPKTGKKAVLKKATKKAVKAKAATKKTASKKAAR